MAKIHSKLFHKYAVEYHLGFTNGILLLWINEHDFFHCRSPNSSHLPVSKCTSDGNSPRIVTLPLRNGGKKRSQSPRKPQRALSSRLFYNQNVLRTNSLS